MSSLWSKLAFLRFRIESEHRTGKRHQVSPAFVRHTTTLHLAGLGAEGLGEDVLYETDDQLAFQAAELPELAGQYTLDDFSNSLDELDLFCGHPPARESARDYRRWTLESAALDLALQQNGLSLTDALERKSEAVRYVVSLGLGNPPSMRPLHDRLEVDPAMEFKLDASEHWDADLCSRLAETGRVRTVDLKGYYSGTPVDLRAEPELYQRVAEHFPETWIEDAALTPATLAVLKPHLERLSFDAPIHRVADLQALPISPRCVNVKPSRSGRIRDLLELYEYCETEGLSMYAGGQFELGIGRQQVQRLASIFHPNSSNDCSPVCFHSSDVDPTWPTSPLELDSNRYGFR